MIPAGGTDADPLAVWVAMRNGQATPSQGSPTAFGRAVVAVGTTPPPPLVIPTSAGSTLAGRIVLEGAADGVAPANFQLAAHPGGRFTTSGPMGPNTPVAVIASDWTFRMNGLVEPSLIAFSGPAGWWLKSLTIDGAEAADTLIPFGQPEASRQDVVAVFSRTATGTVSDERGRTLNYSVVAFPVDTRGWFVGSRHVQVGRPNQTGMFSLSVPPGEYWLAAVDSLGVVVGPQTLAGIAPFAVVVVGGEGQRVQRDLQLVRLPQ